MSQEKSSEVSVSFADLQGKEVCYLLLPNSPLYAEDESSEGSFESRAIGSNRLIGTPVLRGEGVIQAIVDHANRSLEFEVLPTDLVVIGQNLAMHNDLCLHEVYFALCDTKLTALKELHGENFNCKIFVPSSEGKTKPKFGRAFPEVAEICSQAISEYEKLKSGLGGKEDFALDHVLDIDYEFQIVTSLRMPKGLVTAAAFTNIDNGVLEHFEEKFGLAVWT